MSANAEAERAKIKVVGITMFDMSAAFDTVEKTTLCEKLWYLAISKGGIRWIESYMNGRKTKRESRRQRVLLRRHNIWDTSGE